MSGNLHHQYQHQEIVEEAGRWAAMEKMAAGDLVRPGCAAGRGVGSNKVFRWDDRLNRC